MRIVLVGDRIIESGWCLEELKQIAHKYGAEYTAIDWETKNVEDLRVKNLKIEKEGPSAVEPPKELRNLVQKADMLIVHFCPVSAELIDAGKSLKVIATLRTGLTNIDTEHAKERDIPVVNLPGRLNEAVSDFTIGLIIALGRGIVAANNSLLRGQWTKNFESNEKFIEIAGKTVGVIGLGGIGRSVARKLGGFDVDLLGYDPFVTQEDVESLGVKLVELKELLSSADIVTIHTKLTESSKGLIGAPELSLMKPKSFLINTARAEVIDRQALYDVLSNEKIAGAALDVHWKEPIDNDDPFIKLDNVVLTPHISGTMKESLLKSFSRLSRRLEPYYEELAKQ